MVSKHGSLYTISREDIFDFLRCPKIVSIKAYSRRFRPTPKASAKTPIEAEPSVIGQIGELGTALAFSENGFSLDQIEKRLGEHLDRLGLLLNSRMQKILNESLAGLERVRTSIVESYGHLDIVGRGESRYSIMPCYGLPDFVALDTRRNKPVLIEVKNTQKKSKQDDFQAKFYNTLESTAGVIVLSERREHTRYILSPEAIFPHDSETLVIYPRLGEWTKITQTLDINSDLVKEVWKAKQLGFQRRWPSTRCDPKCPHTRFGKELQEDNMEVSKPLPLILAKGMEKMGTNLDAIFLESYLQNRIPEIALLRFKFGPQITEFLARNFDLDKSEAERIVLGQVGRPSFSEIAKLMSNEISKWKKILADTLSIGHAMSLSSRIFLLPKESSPNIRKSWNKWEH